MEFWLWTAIAVLLFVILLLSVRIFLLRKSAREIEAAFSQRLNQDTNTLIDISSRDRTMRQLAESINRQLRLLRRERQRYQQGDLELKEAVTNISHDLRTPLTAVCGYLDLLDQEPNTQNAKRYLQIIRSRTEALRQLSEELFGYSLAASAAGELTLEPVSLRRAVEESVSAYYGALKSRGIAPEIVLPEKEVLCMADRKALARVLGNLISNAVKYSGGDLAITLGADGTLVFSNLAPGLDELQAEKLFHRFYTVEDAKNSTGLGLSIARLLTEQMGGEISAAYEAGRLFITLRMREAPDSVRTQWPTLQVRRRRT